MTTSPFLISMNMNDWPLAAGMLRVLAFPECHHVPRSYASADLRRVSRPGSRSRPNSEQYCSENLFCKGRLVAAPRRGWCGARPPCGRVESSSPADERRAVNCAECGAKCPNRARNHKFYSPREHAAVAVGRRQRHVLGGPRPGRRRRRRRRRRSAARRRAGRAAVGGREVAGVGVADVPHHEVRRRLRACRVFGGDDATPSSIPSSIHRVAYPVDAPTSRTRRAHQPHERVESRPAAARRPLLARRPPPARCRLPAAGRSAAPRRSPPPAHRPSSPARPRPAAKRPSRSGSSTPCSRGSAATRTLKPCSASRNARLRRSRPSTASAAGRAGAHGPSTAHCRRGGRAARAARARADRRTPGSASCPRRGSEVKRRLVRGQRRDRVHRVVDGVSCARRRCQPRTTPRGAAAPPPRRSSRSNAMRRPPVPSAIHSVAYPERANLEDAPRARQPHERVEQPAAARRSPCARRSGAASVSADRRGAGSALQRRPRPRRRRGRWRRSRAMRTTPSAAAKSAKASGAAWRCEEQEGGHLATAFTPLRVAIPGLCCAARRRAVAGAAAARPQPRLSSQTWPQL